MDHSSRVEVLLVRILNEATMRFWRQAQLNFIVICIVESWIKSAMQFCLVCRLLEQSLHFQMFTSKVLDEKMQLVGPVALSDVPVFALSEAVLTLYPFYFLHCAKSFKNISHSSLWWSQ